MDFVDVKIDTDHIFRRHIKNFYDKRKSQFFSRPYGTKWIWDTIIDSMNDPDEIRYEGGRIRYLSHHEFAVGRKYNSDLYKWEDCFTIAVVFEKEKRKVITAYPITHHHRPQWMKESHSKESI